MELVYYDPALLPYARPTGVYARARRQLLHNAILEVRNSRGMDRPD
jgi:hypothetical protein